MRRFLRFGCHIKYICASWILLFGLLTASIPTGIVLLWLLHQKGLFDPVYDWWNEFFGGADQRNRIRSKIAKDVRPAHLRHRKGNSHDVQYKHMLKPSYDRKKRCCGNHVSFRYWCSKGPREYPCRVADVEDYKANDIIACAHSGHSARCYAS